GLRHVAVEDEVQRAAARDAGLERERDRARERRDALVRGCAAPAEGKREFRLALLDVEVLEMLANRAAELVRFDLPFESNGRLQHLKVLARQELARLRHVHRVAESCTLYSEAPKAVARMHSPAGSRGQGSAPASMRFLSARPRRRPMSPKSRHSRS